MVVEGSQDIELVGVLAFWTGQSRGASGLIKLRDLKAYAAKNMQGTVFARIIACEAEELTEVEFRSKLATWFQILKLDEESYSEVNLQHEGDRPPLIAQTIRSGQAIEGL